MNLKFYKSKKIKLKYHLSITLETTKIMILNIKTTKINKAQSTYKATMK